MNKKTLLTFLAFLTSVSVFTNGAFGQPSWTDFSYHDWNPGVDPAIAGNSGNRHYECRTMWDGSRFVNIHEYDQGPDDNTLWIAYSTDGQGYSGAWSTPLSIDVPRTWDIGHHAMVGDQNNFPATDVAWTAQSNNVKFKMWYAAYGDNDHYRYSESTNGIYWYPFLEYSYCPPDYKVSDFNPGGWPGTTKVLIKPSALYHPEGSFTLDTENPMNNRYICYLSASPDATGGSGYFEMYISSNGLDWKLYAWDNQCETRWSGYTTGPSEVTEFITFTGCSNNSSSQYPNEIEEVYDNGEVQGYMLWTDNYTYPIYSYYSTNGYDWICNGDPIPTIGTINPGAWNSSRNYNFDSVRLGESYFITRSGVYNTGCAIVKGKMSAEVETPAGQPAGDISVNYRLYQWDSQTCTTAAFTFSTDGSTFVAATMGSGGDGTADLATGIGGYPHSYVWDSAADLPGGASGVLFRVQPTGPETGSYDTTDPFDVGPPATTTTTTTTTSTTTSTSTTFPTTTTTTITTSTSTTLVTTPTPTPPPPTPTPTLTPAIVCDLISEGFDNFDLGTRPAGWTFINCNQNSDTYTTPGDYGIASPSIKLDADGDTIVTASFSNPDELTFWLKGIGTDASSCLAVEEYYSSTWFVLTTICDLPLTGSTFGIFSLDPATTRIRFSYSRSLGNLAFDDVCLSQGTATTTSSTTTTTTTSTSTTFPTTTTTTTTTTTSTTLVGSPTPIPTVSPTETPTPTATPTTTPSPTPTCGPTVPLTRMVIDSGDYDGDSTDDVAIFRGSSGRWAVRGITRIVFGGGSDQPVPADYDGDNLTEIAIYRGGTGLWAVRNLTRIKFGASTDIPLPGDYDGDGTADIALFRETSGMWAIRSTTRFFFGGVGDWPVAGLFQGPGAKEVGIFRPAASLWAIRNLTRAFLGVSGDWPVAGDYDGDGTWNIAIFRPDPSALWAIRDYTRIRFGKCTDWPVPADYDGNGVDDPGIFRLPNGTWAVRNITRTSFGDENDTPVTR